MTDGYETDFHRWAETQAGLLRTRSANALDWDNLAEEIAALARNDQRDLASRIQTVLDHLIRQRASPAVAPRHATARHADPRDHQAHAPCWLRRPRKQGGTDLRHRGRE